MSAHQFFGSLCVALLCAVLLPANLPAQEAKYKAGEDVEIDRFGEWLPGRVLKHDQYGILVMLPLADGTYDEHKSSSTYAQAKEVRRPAPGGGKPKPKEEKKPAGSDAKFAPGQVVQVNRFGEWVPGQVVEQNRDGVLVRLPMPDGTYNPHKSFQSYYTPDQVMPAGAATPPDPEAQDAAAAETREPADGAGPGDPGKDPVDRKDPARKTDPAAADADVAPLLGTWATAVQVVFNVVDSKRISKTQIREYIQMQGGAVGGFLHIESDGTYIRRSPDDKKSRGRWRKGNLAGKPGIILEKAVLGKDDLHVSLRPNDQIKALYYPDGSSGYDGWRPEKGTVHWDLEPWTDPSFYQQTWTLTRLRRNPILKSDYGVLQVQPDGTWTHTDEGKTTTGKWEASKANDDIVLHGLMGKGNFTFQRVGRDRRLGYVYGSDGPSVNAELAFYTSTAE